MYLSFYSVYFIENRHEISHKNNMVIIKDNQGNIIEENDINPLIVKEFKNS